MFSMWMTYPMQLWCTIWRCEFDVVHLNQMCTVLQANMSESIQWKLNEVNKMKYVLDFTLWIASETQTHIHTIIRNMNRCRDLISLQPHLHLLGFAYFYGILCSMAILSQLLNVFIVSYADAYTCICINMQCSQCVDTDSLLAGIFYFIRCLRIEAGLSFSIYIFHVWTFSFEEFNYL